MVKLYIPPSFYSDPTNPPGADLDVQRTPVGCVPGKAHIIYPILSVACSVATVQSLLVWGEIILYNSPFNVCGGPRRIEFYYYM